MNEIVGFFGLRSMDGWGTFDLVGEVADLLDRNDPPDEVEVVMIDRWGNRLGAYFVGAAMCRILAVGDSGGTRLRVKGFMHAWPGEPVNLVWSRWWLGRPQVVGTWVSYSDAEKKAWLEVVRLNSRFHVQAKRAGPFVLAGRDVIDVPSFYCALGEAIGGPGGYYGANLDGLADCMSGGFGPVPPFVLKWSESGDARSLMREKLGKEYFEKVMGLFAECGVEVLME
ncbi:barstar family protein [Amycolatopsis rifamycinica]|uniref:Barstar (barnase inhibitor) domain-containing protein n=1 Tax=Amycolatopsis rifamycinica TaxID=287986 RepID=A0A066U158_9PSEU|nr:barstar family protein [Amycolatopsis rifamycinica]KDN17973.1 hypothetical protein DV20_33220 [Amycolatopsis rifamycinica]